MAERLSLPGALVDQSSCCKNSILDYLLFKTGKFMFSTAELFGRTCGSVESAFSETCSFREDRLEVVYRSNIFHLP